MVRGREGERDGVKEGGREVEGRRDRGRGGLKEQLQTVHRHLSPYLADLSHTVSLQAGLGELLQLCSGNGRHKVEVVLVIELCSAVLTHSSDVG